MRIGTEDNSDGRSIPLQLDYRIADGQVMLGTIGKYERLLLDTGYTQLVQYMSRDDREAGPGIDHADEQTRIGVVWAVQSEAGGVGGRRHRALAVTKSALLEQTVCS